MLDWLLRTSVDRRWLVVLITVAVAGLGVYSLKQLPIDAVPDITNNQVQINTESAALSPVEVEKQITFPVETALAGIPGLQSTRSLSRNGFSQVTAIFDDDVDIYFARQQVNERLTEAKEGLPPGADPRMGPISTGLGEVYMYAVEFVHPNGEGADKKDGEPGWQPDGSYLTPEGQRLSKPFERAAYLRTVQDWIIRPQLRTVKDVAGVDSIGGYEKQYHVQPDPMKLVSYGLGFGEVIGAIQRNNASTGAGYVEHNGESYLVRSAGRIESVDQIGDIVVGTRGGVPVYVRDVAEVCVGKQLRTGSASENGDEIVVGTALMLIGANSRTVAASVDQKMTEINRALPPDVTAKTVLNRTKLVDATIGTVERNLTEGAILVVAVLLLLLGNIRAAVITATAIPLSMLITATGMVRAKVSGNLMSLGAVDFGLIVDGAVIIVENTLRHLAHRQHEMGRRLTVAERLETVVVSSREMIRPSVFGQAIIITVYLPVLLLTGVEGKMFRPMALTVIFALAGAFVLSLTFVPAVVAMAMGGKISERENWLVRAAKWVYLPALNWAVRLRWVAVAAAVVAFAGAVLLFIRLGSEFAPTLDEKDIAVQAVRIPSTSLTQSQSMQADVERTLKAKFPEIAFVFSKTGTAEMASDPMPPSATDTFLILKPADQWPDPKEDKASLIDRIGKALADVPGNNYEYTQPIQMRFNELIAGTRGDVAIKVYGDDFDQLNPAADAIAAVLSKIPGAADVKVEQTEGLPVMDVTVDRAAAARFGLNVADVQDVVSVAVGGREAGVVFEGDRRFDLVVRLPDAMREDLAAIERLPVPLPHREDGRLVSTSSVPPQPFVPLGAVAKVRVSEGTNQVSRENGKRRVVVQANVRGRDLGSFVAEAQSKIGAEVKLPAGYWLSFGGQFENLVAARQRLTVVVPVCFFLIFVLLYGSFGSVKHAAMVFLCVPLALTGGVAALWLRDMPFSISAAIGFIALSGVAVLNGLVMVSHINRLMKDGKSVDDAVRQGSTDRLRPVLMTALVASLGFVPMAIAHGTGAEVQKPLATVVIGGLVSATILTLLVLPGVYRIGHRRESE